ncbi:hypothetical protein B0H19DRAFT_1370756 [Mycena capillaripes]|nr:hypothetical protein B0H19DRAFT_1370756 [Mycena capillaripes]
MPSFSQIAALATVALAAFTTAAPVAAPKRDLVPLPAILSQLVADLTPVAAVLSSMDASNATAEVVTPITDELQSIITGAVSQVSALAGSPVSTILSTADGVISVTDAAQLLAPALTIVYGAVQDVLNVVGSGPAADVIQPLLNEVTGALAPLLTTIAPLVNGLIAALAPLLGPLVNTLDSLGLGPVVGLVGSII